MRHHLSHVCAFVLGGCYVVPLPERSLGDRDSGAGFGTSDSGVPGYAGYYDKDGSLALPDTQHPACRFPRSFDTSAPAWLRTDALGKPALDGWRGIPCAQVGPIHPCDAATHCPFAATCIQVTRGEPGFCAELVECASGVPLTYRAGECAVCSSPANKAALCCAGIPGVDCRAWPFTGSSRPGESCFDDTDCESGLVCSSPGKTGFASCVCPGVRAESVAHPEDCGFSSAPGAWGTPAVVAALPCQESAPGWVDELIDGTEPFDHDRLSALRAPDGSIHLFFARGGALRRARVQDGSVILDDFESTLPASPNEPAAFAIDASGALHVAYTDYAWQQGRYLPFGAYVTDAGGSWEPVGIAEMLIPTDIVLDGANAPVVVGRRMLVSPASGQFAGSVWRLSGGNWLGSEFDTGSAYPENVRAAFSSFGELSVYWSQRFQTRFVHGEAITHELFDIDEQRHVPAALDLAIAPNGVIHLVFDAASELLNGQEIGRGQVRTLRQPGAEQPELLYDQADPRYLREPTLPSVAFGPAGELTFAQRAPAGILLLQEQGTAGAIAEQILSHAPTSFELAVDGSGQSHLFYVAKGNYPWEPSAYAEELHHVHRGSCP